VVDDLECGRFGSVNEAREHYGIGGGKTISRWVRKIGKNNLLAKVVRVEKPDEKDQVKELKKQVRRLEQLLGRKEAEKILAEVQLEEACESMGISVAELKKKHGIDALRRLAGGEGAQ